MQYVISTVFEVIYKISSDAAEFKVDRISKYVLSRRRLFYKWEKSYFDEVAEEASLFENEKQGVYCTKDKEMTLAKKFKVIMETSKLSEEDFAAYCRKKGLYANDIEKWKQELSDFLDSDYLDANAAKQLRSEIKDTRSQLGKILKKAAGKDKEIASKDRALASYAAKVVAMRNFQKLFSDDTN